MKNNKKFKEMFTAMSERYGKEFFPALSKMLWDSLKPFSDQECIDAFNHVFRHGKFFNDLIPDLFAVLEKSDVKQISTNAQIELDKILCHFKQYGASQYPELTDPISLHLMTKRWPYQSWASMVLASELVWWGKEFIEAYRAYRAGDMPLELEASEPVLRIVEGIG